MTNAWPLAFRRQPVNYQSGTTRIRGGNKLMKRFNKFYTPQQGTGVVEGRRKYFQAAELNPDQ